LILYIDTSTLLKLYVDEADSEHIERLVESAAQSSTSLIAYAEMQAGLSRARRVGRLPDEAYRFALAGFEELWDTMFTIEVLEPLIRFGGELARRYPLRGFDAVHLASAISLLRSSEQQIIFSSADSQLIRAARAEGLVVA